MRSRRSIRSLLVALLAVFALFLVGTGTYSAISTYRVSARHAEEVALNIAEVTAVSTRLFVDDTRAMLERLAAASDLDSENSACEEWIESAVLLRPRYSNVVVADAEGRPICSTTQNVQRRRSGAGRPWFETVRTAREFTIGMPERGLLTGRWITIFAYPLSGPEGSFLGAVGVSVELDKFRTLVSGATLPADAVITLSHLDGTVIARSSDHEDWVGRSLPSSTLDPDADARGIGFNRASGAEGIDRLWGFRDVADTPWRVFAGVPAEQVYGAVRASLARQAAVLVAVMALLVLATGLFYRRISSSLDSLVDWAREAANRTWNGVSPQNGPAEIAEVARAFGRTLEDRTAAEMRALDAKEQYRSILENAVFGIYRSTLDGQLQQVNPAFVRMLGYVPPKSFSP